MYEHLNDLKSCQLSDMYTNTNQRWNTGITSFRLAAVIHLKIACYIAALLICLFYEVYFTSFFFLKLVPAVTKCSKSKVK